MTRPIPRPLEGTPDIITFCESEHYLHKPLTVAHRAIHKAVFAGTPCNEHLELTREERIVLAGIMEGRPIRPGGYDEIVIVGGIRSGKTDRLEATAMTYEAVRWGPVLGELLAKGQNAVIPLVAQDERAVGELKGYIEGNLQQLEEPDCDCGPHWPAVFQQTTGQARAIVGEEIRTAWQVVFRIYPPKRNSLRAMTALAGALDEIAHWETGEGAYNQDKAIVKAFRGRFATLARLKATRWMVSSPDLEEGVLWEEFKARASTRALVVQAATWELHPPGSTPAAPTQEWLDREQEKDPEAFAAECGAQFRKHGGDNVFLDARAVDRNVTRGVTRRAPVAGNEHAAWIDAAFKRDRFSVSVAHAQRAGEVRKVVQDACRHWTPEKARRGSKPVPLDHEPIVEEIVTEYLRPFGCDTVHGDQHCDVVLAKEFRKHGITFILVPASKGEKFEAYKNLRAALNADLVELLDDPVTIRDLKGLVRKDTPDGYTVSAPKRRSAYDDASTPVSRLVKKLLPLTDRVDLSELNASARAKRYPDADCRERRETSEVEFGGGLMEAIY